MPPSHDLPHLILPQPGRAERFSPRNGGGETRRPSPVPDREQHAQALLGQLRDIAETARTYSRRRDLDPIDRGVFVEVTSRENEPLAVDSLELRRSNIELLVAQRSDNVIKANLFVPATKLKILEKRVEDYRTKNYRDTERPCNQNLVEGIARFRLATLQDLWADDSELFPNPGQEFFWETWLRPGSINRFKAAAERLRIPLGPVPLEFPETDIIRVLATPEKMAELLAAAPCIAQTRRSAVTAEIFDNLRPDQQYNFSQELLDRVRFRGRRGTYVSICILDTGVNRGHPIIAPALHENDCYSVDPGWGADDHRGHGTELAGVALYQDLVQVLDRNQTIEVPFRLESVKIIPWVGDNPYDQLGSVTKTAFLIAELSGHNGHRVFCLASSTTEDTPHDGFPTSWSSALDQLASGIGTQRRQRRLFCVSVGNIRQRIPFASNYPAENDNAEAESPSQAWNVISVGAFTEKQMLTDPNLAGYSPLARPGDLSPNSRTASWWKTWPITPDIVLEGGNLAVDPADGCAWQVQDLAILTTSNKFPNSFFTTTRDTSAATANAARLAAILHTEYPDLWPESIRALLVGSARWTDAMKAYLPERPTKSDYGLLLRRYGHGVPDLDRARRSASNVLTLIAQDSLQPYGPSPNTGSPIINEMKLFELPWPREALEAIPTQTVSMRVTLSYFIEPNPSESARNRKARYASHGLRFRVIRPGESVDVFRARINSAVEPSEDDMPVRGSDSDGWTIGSDQRNVGSIHSDTWTGPASDLARRGVIAVHPVGGWWKERKHLQRWDSRARFSLVVTINAGEAEIDVYTPVSVKIASMITV